MQVAFDFKGQVALVTGGSTGIGAATALAFGRAGAKVVVAARRTAESEAVVKAITAAGGTAMFVKTDVSQAGEIQALVEAAVAAYGRLDIAFNNAGVEETPSPFAGKTDAEFHRIMDINVKGVLQAMQAEVPAMLKSGGGAIVNTSSVAGLVGLAQAPIYVASKHAVEGLTKAVALEFGTQGIRVNAVAPAAIETPMIDRFATTPEMRQGLTAMHPIGRMGQPEEVAAAVLWLCSDAASFVTGATLAVDGGWTAQ